MLMPKPSSWLGGVMMGIGGMGRGKGAAEAAKLAALKGGARVGGMGALDQALRIGSLERGLVGRGVRRTALGVGVGAAVGRASGSRGLRGRSSGGMTGGGDDSGYPTGMYGQ